jgi:fatty acid desaturase
MTRSRPSTRTTPTTNETHEHVARSTILLWFVLVGFAWLGGVIALANGTWLRTGQDHTVLVLGVSFIIGLLTFCHLSITSVLLVLPIRSIVGLCLVVQIALYVPSADCITAVDPRCARVCVGMS